MGLTDEARSPKYFFHYYGSVTWFSRPSRSLALLLWEQKTETARFARSNGPDVYQNSVHMMI